MAVLHLLGCTDCHYENLIASGDQLVLIDTETLLEADLRDLISDDGDDPNHLSNLQTSMQDSVLRSGLLPQWLMVGAGKKRAFDISALGIQPPPAEREMPGWLGLNSDGMMAGRSTQPCELPTSLPVGLGKPQRLTDFAEQLCDGFALQLQEAMRLRTPLMEALSQFSGKPRRLVARATRLYFTIQRQMLEPASLRSAVAHGLKLEQLSRSFVLAGEKPLNWPMFRAELLQMERLDIPFYEHMIDGDELPLPEGLAPIPEFMKASGLAAAWRRLEQLDQPEIAFQQQLIRGAIAARHLKTNASSPAAALGTETATAADAFDRDVYLQEALRLGEELWDAAIRDSRGRPEWLGMDLGADGESFHFGLIGQSLYSGGSGIALLFARLALAHAGEAAELWRHRAWSCLATLAELAERNSNEQLFRLVRDLPYGISGSGGILLALHLLDSAGLEAAAPLAEQLIHQLRPERLLADEGVDVIGGVTGLIGPLLLIGTSRAQELAAVCGERLVTLQLDSGGWGHGAASSQRKPPLTGFSHGAAGMAAALARLFRAKGDARFAKAAAKALGYERSVFVSERGNWPDFRSSNEADAFMLSWCHGAPGILLSRQAIKEAGLADAASDSELGVARSSTLTALGKLSGTSVDVAAHLCCGVLGLTSLLRLDAQASGLSLEPAVLNAERSLISRARASSIRPSSRPIQLISTDIMRSCDFSADTVWVVDREVHVLDGAKLCIVDGTRILILNGVVPSSRIGRAALIFDPGSTLSAARFSVYAGSSQHRISRTSDNGGLWFLGTYAAGASDGIRVLKKPAQQPSIFQAVSTTSRHSREHPSTQYSSKKRLLYDKWWIDSRYRYGDVPMKTQKLSSAEFRDLWVKARKSFYRIASIVRRALDPWNCNDAFSRKVFFTLNMLFKKEVGQRTGLPMGDLNHDVEITKAKHADITTYQEFIQTTNPKPLKPQLIQVR